jgi:hypothetical protein
MGGYGMAGSGVERTLGRLPSRQVPKPEVLNGLRHNRWLVDVGGSVRRRLPPPGRTIRPYQTSGHLPVAVPHAFVVIRPATGVGTSAHAI